MIVSRLSFPAPPHRVEFNNVRPAGITATSAVTGNLARLPLNRSRSDEWTIIANLQAVVDGYGRLPLLREYALRIAPPRQNMDVVRQAAVLFRWVKDNVIYQPDPDGAEFVQTPARMLEQISTGGRSIGDCDDHVVLLGSLLVALGIPSRVAGVRINQAGWYNHVIIMARLQGNWIDLDPCVKNGPQPPYPERLVSGL